MAINRLFIFALLFGSFLLLNFKCHKSVDCFEAKYSFTMDFTARPDKDSIRVGDTIWLQTSSSTTALDYLSGNLVDYSKAVNLGTAISFYAYSVSSNKFIIEAGKKFDFFVVDGKEVSSINPNTTHEFLFKEVDNKYMFNLGIVSKETGIFRFGLSNAADVYRTDNKCTKATFTMNFKNTNQHFHLFPGGAGTPPGGGVYYFKVY